MTDSNVFIIVPLGVGDAFSEKYYSSGFWISYAGCSMLIDCAHPIRKILYEAKQESGIDIRLENLNAILITHLHGDHASGLEGIGFFSYYIAKRKVSLLAHQQVLDDIWPWHLQGVMAPLCDPPDTQRAFEDFFTPVPMNETSATLFGPFLIEVRQTLHHVPTYALRITAGNKTFGYSSDTSFDPSLIDWLASADLIVHETNVGTHTPYEKLAALPSLLRNKMRLIHYPDDFDKKRSIIIPLEQGKPVFL